ncbi:hypothetical protein [Mangrovibacterium marinum]|nr:hypothetical protein [Mangrovibacterium marinum]
MAFCTILGKIILSVLVGFLLAGGGWLLAVFLTKAANQSDQLKVGHHVLCFFIAVFTFIVYQFIAVTGTGLHYIDKTTRTVRTELANNPYLQEQIRSIAAQTPQTEESNTQEQAEALISNINLSIKQKYPRISKVVDFDNLEQNKKFKSRLARLLADAERDNAQGLIEAFSDQYIAGLRKPLARTRLKLIILLTVVQLVQAVVLVVWANRSSAPFFDDSYNSSFDY